MSADTTYVVEIRMDQVNGAGVNPKPLEDSAKAADNLAGRLNTIWRTARDLQGALARHGVP